MSIPIKRMMSAAVMFLFALGLSRAAIYRFRQQEDAFRQACRAQLQKLGLTRAAAKTKYPTPEIHMVSAACLLPGRTGETVVKGKFVPESKFVFQNDNIEVVKEQLTGGEYRATLKAAPGIGPQTASLLVISPVTALTAQHPNAASVGGRYEWTIQAANGWKIVARSRGPQACEAPAEDPYEVAFYRKGKGAPFEKRNAKLYFSLWEKTNYRFAVSATDAQSQQGMDEYTNLMKKMSDRSLTQAQRQELMQKLQQASQQMQASIRRMTDPAYVKQQQEKQQQFGCERIELEYPGGGSFTGQMRCADKVGTRIALTGTLATLK